MINPQNYKKIYLVYIEYHGLFFRTRCHGVFTAQIKIQVRFVRLQLRTW